MIDVILKFFTSDGEKLVAAALPALPHKDHSFLFQDSDRDLSLRGIVTDVEWEELDGELSIIIIIEGK